MMRTKALGTLMLVASLLLAACGGGAPKEPTVAPTEPVSATSTTTQATPTRPQEQPTAPQPQTEEYDFGQASDLAALDSYRVRSTMQWESIIDGKKEMGSWDVLEEFVRQPPAQRFVWTGTGAGEVGTESGEWELIQIGKDSYMDTGSGWLAMTAGEEGIFGSNAFLSAPLGMVSANRGKLVERNVMVNGVSTDKYVFDESTLGASLGLGAVARADGEVWISPQVNVVVKYMAHYEGKNLALGGGEEGKMDVTFDLTDINQPIDIRAPEGVKSAMPEDIPVMDGATDVVAIEGIIAYQTTYSVEEATAFYQTQMPAQGWTMDGGGIPGMVSFTKGNRTAQVMIMEAEGKTSVTVMVSEE